MSMSDSPTAAQGAERNGAGQSVEEKDLAEVAASIDWPQLYIDEVGAPQARLKKAARIGAIQDRTGCSFDRAEDIVSEAIDKGFLTRTQNGFVPPDKDIPDGWQTLRPAKHVVEETGNVSDAVSELTDAVEDLKDSAVSNDVVRVLEQNTAVMERMADEMDSIRDGVSEAKEMAQNRSDDERDMQRAVTELQARELQNGASLSKSNVDTERLEGDVGLELSYFDDGRFVTAASAESGDEKNIGADMPDSSEMCKAEQWRQMWKRGLLSEDGLKAGEYRAMRLWHELEKIAEVGTGGHFVRSSKARAALIDGGNGPIADLGDDSQVTAANRAMKRLATEWAKDVVETENRDGKRVLTFKKDDLEKAKKPLYAASESDGGDILLPNGGGVE